MFPRVLWVTSLLGLLIQMEMDTENSDPILYSEAWQIQSTFNFQGDIQRAANNCVEDGSPWIAYPSELLVSSYPSLMS